MDTLAKIIQILEKMVDIHARLLNLTKEKRVTLVEENIPSLQNIINQESSWVEQIQRLEEERKQLINQYFSDKGVSSSLFTTQDLLQTVENQEAKNALSVCSQKLKELIEEIKLLNQTNQELIKQSLSYIQFSLGIILRQEPAIGYGPRSASGYRSFLDAKI